MSEKLLQARLKELGWYTGAVDGVVGPLTRLAIIDFKKAHGLRARDYVGPITRDLIFGDAAKRHPEPVGAVGEPAWLAEARRLLGVRETPGKASTPVIMDWADDLDIHYSGDDVPWCGLFVAHCLRVGAPSAALPSNPLGARAYSGFGQFAFPRLGAVMVFWRGRRDGALGHVGFYVGEDERAFFILGGNQGDAVSIARVGKDRLLDARWVAGDTVMTSRRLLAADGRPLSMNEA